MDACSKERDTERTRYILRYSYWLESSLIFHLQVLSKDFVEGAALLLITRFIPLNQTDLDRWISDPEEWMGIEENENEHWEYQLRVSSSRYAFVVFSHCGVILPAMWRKSFNDTDTAVSTIRCSIVGNQAERGQL